jgi:UDP-galactopyranose mutase
MYDFLIAGAGVSGLVAAERLCNGYGKRCIVVDRRQHIAGNCFDARDEHGVLIHRYGPHYFRTNSEQIVEYLGRFSGWIPGAYRVSAFTDGRYWSFPINLETFEQYLGRPSSTAEMEAWLSARRPVGRKISNSEDYALATFGDVFYEMFFKGYTLKQWCMHPRDLDASVVGRIPIRLVRDDRYFNDLHQVLPADGYTALFENVIHSCGDRLSVALETNFFEVRERVRWRHAIFTGPIDEFFGFQFGRLPYRTLRFEPRYFTAAELPGDAATGIAAGFAQPTVQVNYPGAEPWTRSVEAKHITKQNVSGSTVVREYPEAFGPGKEPYYPVPTVESRRLYESYRQAARGVSNVTFLGRLGTYRYLNIDQVVAMTLKGVESLVAGVRR